MPTNVLNTASYFLQLAEATGGLTPMKLSRLVYIAYGWYAERSCSPLFDSAIYAYDFGPVIPDLEIHLKSFGNAPMTSSAQFLRTSFLLKQAIPEEIRALLQNVWHVYGPYTGNQLANLTHIDGSPWKTTLDGNPEQVNPQISLDAFIAHYHRLAQRAS